MEECDEDPRNITIPELEGEHTVSGPPLQTIDVTKALKLKEVNIGTEEKPNLAKIGDYQDNDTIGKVMELLMEWQGLSPMEFLELKGITRDLGVMHITLKPYVCPIKQQPYRLNPKYKQKFREEIDKMIATGIIEQVEHSDWVIPMVVQEKKTKGEIRISCEN